MTPMDRYIAAADALEARVSEADRRLAWEALGFGNDFADGVETDLAAYRAAREAITAAGVNDMNEGKE